MRNISQFTISHTKNIRDVMKKISLNKKRFVFVLNNKNKLLGVLTDGDVRRYLLKKGRIKDLAIKAINKDFKYIKAEEEAESILKLLDQKYEFIPILDSKGKLKDIIDRDMINL